MTRHPKTPGPKPKREGLLFVQVGTEMLAQLDAYAQALREKDPWSKANRSDAVRQLLAIALEGTRLAREREKEGQG